MKSQKAENMDTFFKEITTLAEQTKNGSDAAFAGLFKLLYPKIYSYIFYRVNSAETAEDITGDVFEKLVKNIGTQKGNFLAWVYSIAKNKIIDNYRKTSFRSSIDKKIIEDTYQENKSKDFTEKLIEQDRVKRALKKLSKEQSEVIILKFFQGYKNPEIAEIMNKKIGAIKGLQFRAMKNLKVLLSNKDI